MTKETRKYQLIQDYLRSISPHAVNGKEVARRLNLNYNTARSYLARLSNEGEIKKTHRGLYRAVLDVDSLRRASAAEDVDIRLHGLKLEGRLCIKDPGGYFADADTFRPPGKTVFDDDFRETFQSVFEGRSMTITIHRAGKSKGLVEIFLKTTKIPMSVLEFLRWEAYLHGVFPLLEQMDFRVRQIGLNCDYKRLRLDGVTSIKLQTFKNAWFQVYNHAEDMLRVEGHLITEISLSEALEILSTLVRSPRPRLMPPDDDDGLMFG